MRICAFSSGASTETGIVVAGDVVVSAAKAVHSSGKGGGSEVRDLLALAESDRADVVAAAQALADGGDTAGTLGSLELGPPVSDPEKIICLGLNYRDHAAEVGLPLPEYPMLFAKFPGALIGDRQKIVPPPGEDVVDYEGELAVVIGKSGRGIARADALHHVGGVMPLNDVSARTLQTVTPQWMAGKAIDTFAPCGPALVTLDEIDDIQNLQVKTTVNGEVLQDGNTGDQIFQVAETIAWLSTLMTLRPGDIIATGTPAGVGVTRDPQILLKEGDEVIVEISGVGKLSNPVGPPADVPSPLRQDAAAAGS